MSTSGPDATGQGSPTKLRELAEAAARLGGELARKSFGRDQEVSLKADRTVVTNVDIEVERAIVAHLRRQRPTDSFIGEEGAGQEHRAEAAAPSPRSPIRNRQSEIDDSQREPRDLRSEISDEGVTSEVSDEDLRFETPDKDLKSEIPDKDLKPEISDRDLGAEAPDEDLRSEISDLESIHWAIDPIDGTRNYVRGIPIFTCSVAALRDGKPVAGAVYDPMQDMMYSASLSGGATANGQSLPLPRGEAASLYGPQARLYVGVPSARRPATRHFVLHAFEQHVVRNLGSAALHLALVATGQLDLMVVGNCKLWDIAAGCLLVTEAGGVVASPSGKPIFPLDVRGYRGQEIPLVAGNSAAYARFVREAGRE